MAVQPGPTHSFGYYFCPQDKMRTGHDFINFVSYFPGGVSQLMGGVRIANAIFKIPNRHLNFKATEIVRGAIEISGLSPFIFIALDITATAVRASEGGLAQQDRHLIHH